MKVEVFDDDVGWCPLTLWGRTALIQCWVRMWEQMPELVRSDVLNPFAHRDIFQSKTVPKGNPYAYSKDLILRTIRQILYVPMYGTNLF